MLDFRQGRLETRKRIKQYFVPRDEEPLTPRARAARGGEAATHPEVTGGARKQTATVLMLPTVGRFPLGSPRVGHTL